jgi:hypothetical protein
MDQARLLAAVGSWMKPDHGTRAGCGGGGLYEVPAGRGDHATVHVAVHPLLRGPSFASRHHDTSREVSLCAGSSSARWSRSPPRRSPRQPRPAQGQAGRHNGSTSSSTARAPRSRPPTPASRGPVARWCGRTRPSASRPSAPAGATSPASPPARRPSPAWPATVRSARHQGKPGQPEAQPGREALAGQACRHGGQAGTGRAGRAAGPAAVGHAPDRCHRQRFL